MSFLTGSICLSDIPKEQIKKVMCKDGKERLYLNIAVCEKKTPLYDENGRVKVDHFISCAPVKKEDRKEGVNYFIGDLKKWQGNNQSSAAPTQEQISVAPSLSDEDPLPF